LVARARYGLLLRFDDVEVGVDVGVLALALELVVLVSTNAGLGVLKSGFSAVIVEERLGVSESRLGSKLGSTVVFDVVDEFAAFCAAIAASATLTILSIEGVTKLATGLPVTIVT
jgi:hypothetical protein